MRAILVVSVVLNDTDIMFVFIKCDYLGTHKLKMTDYLGTRLTS
jgi:hypothetical protein